MQTTAIPVKTKWALDAVHSEIAFKVRHLMISNVKGVFKEFDASIYTTGEDFLSIEIDCWLNPGSIDTGDEKRDEHLKGPDFFDIENHKQITFTGNTYEKAESGGSYELYGELSMKGIAKKIKLEVEFGGVVKDPWGNEKAGFVIKGKINRKDWGMEWNSVLETGGVLLSEEVIINCEVELIKQSEQIY